MSADRDMTRIVRSWLRTDEHESAGRVLDIVLAALDTTPQRRRPLLTAWRIDPVSTYTKLALAATAAVVVAVVGYSLFSKTGSGPGGPPASATPRPTPTPSEPAFPPEGDLAIGRHFLTVEGIRFSIEVPASGWVSDGGYWFTRDTGVTPDGAAILFWSPDNVYADPCAHTPLSPPVGPTAANLADAIVRLPGTDNTTAARDIAAIFGASAEYRQIAIREDVECDAEDFYLVYNQGDGDTCAGSTICQRYATELGSTIRYWIVPRGESRLVIEAETYKGAGPDIGELVIGIVSSIKFE